MNRELDKIKNEYLTTILEMKGISPKLAIHETLRKKALDLKRRVYDMGGTLPNQRDVGIPNTTRINGVRVHAKTRGIGERPYCIVSGCENLARSKGKGRLGHSCHHHYNLKRQARMDKLQAHV